MKKQLILGAIFLMALTVMAFNGNTAVQFMAADQYNNMETKENYTFEESFFTSLAELFKENNKDLEFEKKSAGNEFDENLSPAMFNQAILNYASENLEAENTDIISLFGISPDDSEELSILVDYMDDNEDSVLSDVLREEAIGIWKYNIKGVDIIIAGDQNGDSHLFLAKKDLGVFNDYVKTIDFRNY